MRRLALATLLLAASTNLQAAECADDPGAEHTWHVAVTGHPEAAGTCEDPLDTIKTAHERIRVAPGYTVIRVRAGTYQYPRHRENVITKPRTRVMCETGALLDGGDKRGRFAVPRAITVKADDVWVNGCSIGRHVNNGIRLRGGGIRTETPPDSAAVKRPVVTNNIISQIGNAWKCAGDVEVCVGYGGIAMSNTDDGVFRNNKMAWMQNKDDGGKVHGIYVSNGSERNLIEGNECWHSTGVCFKQRARSDGTAWIGNTCVNVDVCFVSAEPPSDDRAYEQPSRGITLYNNTARDVETFIECRDPKRTKGKESVRNCTRTWTGTDGVEYQIVKPGPWQLVQTKAAKPPSDLERCYACLKGSRNERRACVLRIKRNSCTKKPKSWGRNDCRRCF